MRKLNEKIAIVTGGASGLGRAVAEKFAESGAKVAILDINIELGGKVADEINKKGGNAIAVKCDVTNEKIVDKAFATVLEKYKRIDIAHINAGIIDKCRFINETSFDDWRKIISVNLDGAFLTARNTIKQMLKQGSGAIVFTGSNWCYVCDPGFTSYAASKGGVVSFARALALDHAKDNIRINIVCPGNMYTPLLEEQLSLEKNPEKVLESMGQISKPEEVANLVLFLASDDSSAMKGSAVIIDQGETLGYGPGLSIKKNNL
ncbi:SDR family oxidoreductase [bacterium]|nr:SDR family oxidoreductase [bacterium]MBU4362276.1 SDR family oxidoreductase [bacterium]MBU4602725.1 SDR family oxidoreductase [bacterium]